MTDKPDPADAGFFALADHAIISLQGRDALAFAQAQTMNDVTALADGHWHWNGWLTPKGRVIALFALLRLDVEHAWLLVPDVDPDDIATRLRRFVFRSKVEVAVRDDLHVAGAFTTPTTASDATTGRIAAHAAVDHQTMDAWELDFGSPDSPRTLRISSTAAAANPDASLHWRAVDLRYGLPRMDASQLEQWTPQQLSLARLRAYSVKKGCYPGQEIVARTHFLGQAKRGLALFETDTPVAAGTALTSNGSDVGSVVASTGSTLLAVLPLALDGELHAAAAVLQSVPLRDGLARPGSA